jgi:valyl-tRNA synthetase
VGAGDPSAPLRAGSPVQSQGIPSFNLGTLEDRWILSRFNRVTTEVNDALEPYRFHEAANRIYDFFWGEFCDWYLELIKPRLNFEEGTDPAQARVACGNLVNLFDASLRLLHPVMPFITEEIWQAMYEGNPPLKSIALAGYPQADREQFDLAAETDMAILQDLIVIVRNIRADLMIEHNRGAVERLANVERILFFEASFANLRGGRSTARFDVHVIYERKIDVAAECERQKKELDKMEKEFANNQRQLWNEQFLAKAPKKVVEGLRNRAGELSILIEKAKDKMEDLGCK